MEVINIHSQITDIHQAQFVFKPLLDMASHTREDIFLMDKQVDLRAGRYKKRAYITFEVTTLSQMYVPSQNCVTFFNSCFSDILLFQHQACLTRFDFFVHHHRYCKSQIFDEAILQTIKNMLASEYSLLEIRFLRGGGKGITSHLIKQAMMAKTGFKLEHQFINVSTQRDTDISMSPISGTMSQQVSQNSWLNKQDSTQIIVNDKGQVFDVQEFARSCIKVLENLILFSKDDFIRSLQLETNPKTQEQMLRLLDHRPLVQKLWQETIQFALKKPKCKVLLQLFTQEQMTILFNCNKQQIENTFNHYVNGSTINVIQPHPVRALLDHMALLQACKCFDLSLYNTSQYGANFLHTAYYIGKNFLTEDSYLTNNEGAICYSGTPGAGKTKLQQLTGTYMNGYTLNDTGKGIGEFQNYDIVSKSTIIVEEVQLKKLTNNDWKQTADLLIGQKCKVKNQPDVFVTKYCPVSITTNDNVYTCLLSKVQQQQVYNAVVRRWAFIRYFETWAKGHQEIMQSNYNIAPEFIQVYNPKDIDSQLMNTLIGCALLFDEHYFVDVSYTYSYYSHCLIRFSQTLFGQTCMHSIDQIKVCVNQLRKCSKENDFACRQGQKASALHIDHLQEDYIRMLVSDIPQYYNELSILNEKSLPWYYRCLKLLTLCSIQSLLYTRSAEVLDQWLVRMEKRGQGLYKNLAKHIRMERLMCKNEFFMSQQIVETQGVEKVEKVEKWRPSPNIKNQSEIQTTREPFVTQPKGRPRLDSGELIMNDDDMYQQEQDEFEQMSNFSVTDFYMKKS